MKLKAGHIIESKWGARYKLSGKVTNRLTYTGSLPCSYAMYQVIVRGRVDKTVNNGKPLGPGLFVHDEHKIVRLSKKGRD